MEELQAGQEMNEHRQVGAKETHLYGKRDLLVWQKRPTYMAKATYLYGKETYFYGKSDLRMWCIMLYYDVLLMYMRTGVRGAGEGRDGVPG